jgi:small GTP-binding protein
MVMRVSCALIGDCAIGKTCLAVSYIRKRFLPEYVKTVYEKYSSSRTVDDREFELALWDTTGDFHMERIRQLVYTDVGVVIVCFSLVDPPSLQHIVSKWLPELHKYRVRAPIVLAGLKSDRRDGAHSQSRIATAEGKALMRTIEARGYVECSARNGRGCSALFDAAIRAAVACAQTDK